MAVGLDVQRKLDLVAKRLAAMGAPKVSVLEGSGIGQPFQSYISYFVALSGAGGLYCAALLIRQRGAVF